jgi:GGDEF domain-containing protein
MTAKTEQRPYVNIPDTISPQAFLQSIPDPQLAAAIEEQEGASHAAFHDVLTGLPNRALFNDRLEHGFALAERHSWGLAVMFLDLDDFKIINDSY